MIISDAQLPAEDPKLATIAALYPLAFFMAAVSNSRASLALRRWTDASPDSPRACMDQSWKTPPIS
jgi:hypothetical protein